MKTLVERDTCQQETSPEDSIIKRCGNFYTPYHGSPLRNVLDETLRITTSQSSTLAKEPPHIKANAPVFQDERFNQPHQEWLPDPLVVLFQTYLKCPAPALWPTQNVQYSPLALCQNGIDTLILIVALVALTQIPVKLLASFRSVARWRRHRWWHVHFCYGPLKHTGGHDRDAATLRTIFLRVSNVQKK